MRILAIGDPHGKLPKIPKNIDLILLTGDLGSADLLRKMSFENLKRMRKGLPPKEFPIKQHKKAFLEAFKKPRNSYVEFKALASCHFNSKYSRSIFNK